MSDITRDDLRYWTGETSVGGDPIIAQVTDEEFDRLAREWLIERGGYDMYLAFTMQWIRDNPDRALRALLTDKCPTCGGRGTVTDPRATEASWLEGTQEMLCTVCGGRGWLPRDGLIVFDVGTGEHFAVPVDWLEAEDENG